VKVDYDLETTPLEIKTDSAMGSGDYLRLNLYNSQGHSAGSLNINFISSPDYILWCGLSWIKFPNNLPTATDKIWRLTKVRTPDVRVIVQCNEVVVVNIPMPNSDCSWSERVTKIEFESGKYGDTASDGYRPTRFTGN
jgi:hypothetical protein